MDDYFDLGSYSFSVTTSSAEAQRWFDRGLMWCYGYNHEEAVRCFEKAALLDDSCAMAYWGIAYAAGCNYNRPWEDFTSQELTTVVTTCHKTSLAAKARLAAVTPVEQALITALEKRYQSPMVVSDEAFSAWNDDYAQAMREVYSQFSDNLDVATLFAEALINRTPWQLWNLATGEAAEDADTLEAVRVLETAIAQCEAQGREPHAGLLHIYIHTMEMSPHPEKALHAADTLRDLIPDSGHLLHMPSHIDILCGNYYNAVRANDRAIAVDNRYLAKEGANNFYTFYRIHNYHFKMYAAMFLGQYQTALTAVQDLLAGISEEMLRLESPNMADVLEGVIPMHLHVFIRFGMWQKIIAEVFPEDADFFCATTAMLHYAKAVAHAAMGNITEAEQHRAGFQESYPKVPESRRIFNNTCLDILAIAEAMMNGEIEYRKGNYEQAFAYLRRSVYLDDHLNYAEPWGWMQPARHALGALLLEQGRVEEAMLVYRADLGLDQSLSRPSQHPDNVWSLHGYVECLNKLGRTEEAITMQVRLDLALARTDVSIKASCFCRLEHDDCCH